MIENDMDLDMTKWHPDVVVVYDALCERYGEARREVHDWTKDGVWLRETVYWEPLVGYPTGRLARLRLRVLREYYFDIDAWYLSPPQNVIDPPPTWLPVRGLSLDAIFSWIDKAWCAPISATKNFLLAIGNHRLEPEVLFVNRHEYRDIFGQDPPEREPPTDKELLSD